MSGLQLSSGASFLGNTCLHYYHQDTSVPGQYHLTKEEPVITAETKRANAYVAELREVL